MFSFGANACLSRARPWSVDPKIERYSMLCQTFNHSITYCGLTMIFDDNDLAEDDEYAARTRSGRADDVNSRDRRPERDQTMRGAVTTRNWRNKPSNSTFTNNNNNNNNNKLCWRPPRCPAPCDLDLWPFNLESGVRVQVTCDVGYLCSLCQFKSS